MADPTSDGVQEGWVQPEHQHLVSSSLGCYKTAFVTNPSSRVYPYKVLSLSPLITLKASGGRWGRRKYPQVRGKERLGGMD